MAKQQHMEIVVDKLIKNLERRHMEAHYFKTKEDLIAYLDENIKNSEKITSGGSMTLKELGVIDYLNSREDVKYLDRSHAKDRDEV
ncbi:MAG: lactate utilization protein, partial [Lachnospiraceae bacterium]|nr:lactate utilization protein [Lachnospiraceae bacterium]